MQQQNRTHLRLVRPIQKPLSKSYPKVSTGLIWGWRADHPAPLTIRLGNGEQFACGGLTIDQQRAFNPDKLMGKTVVFTHKGFNRHGFPIDPAFKTILSSLNGGRQ